MSRHIKHSSKLEATSNVGAYRVKLEIPNDSPGSVTITPKPAGMSYGFSHQWLSVSIKDLPGLIRELQWALDRSGEMEEDSDG